jgi:hypothetical protein
MLLVILFLILNSIAGYATIKVASDKEIVNFQNLIMAILLMAFTSSAPFILIENKIFLISLIIVILTDLTVALKVRKLSKTWNI